MKPEWKEERGKAAREERPQLRGRERIKRGRRRRELVDWS